MQFKLADILFDGDATILASLGHLTRKPCGELSLDGHLVEYAFLVEQAANAELPEQVLHGVLGLVECRGVVVQLLVFLVLLRCVLDGLNLLVEELEGGVA